MRWFQTDAIEKAFLIEKQSHACSRTVVTQFDFLCCADLFIPIAEQETADVFEAAGDKHSCSALKIADYLISVVLETLALRVKLLDKTVLLSFCGNGRPSR
jgi:hypothetical protein